MLDEPVAVPGSTVIIALQPSRCLCVAVALFSDRILGNTSDPLETNSIDDSKLFCRG